MPPLPPKIRSGLGRAARVSKLKEIRTVAQRHPRLALFVLAYLTAGFAASIFTRNWEFLGYMIQMVILIWFITWADRRAQFTPGVLWGLAVWGLMHLCGGVVPVPREMAQVAAGPEGRPVLYGLWLIPPNIFKYDNLVHAYGFFAATMACWQALRPWLRKGDRPTLAFFVILAASGMGLGAVNEMIEFAATRLLPKTGVGDYVNNSIDLVYNAVGSVSATVLVWTRQRKGFKRGV